MGAFYTEEARRVKRFLKCFTTEEVQTANFFGAWSITLIDVSPFALYVYIRQRLHTVKFKNYSSGLKFGRAYTHGGAYFQILYGISFIYYISILFTYLLIYLLPFKGFCFEVNCK